MLIVSQSISRGQPMPNMNELKLCNDGAPQEASSLAQSWAPQEASSLAPPIPTSSPFHTFLRPHGNGPQRQPHPSQV